MRSVNVVFYRFLRIVKVLKVKKPKDDANWSSSLHTETETPRQ